MWPTALPPTSHAPHALVDRPAAAAFADPLVVDARRTTSASSSGGASFAPNTPAGTWPAAALPVPFVLALPRSRDVGGETAAELDVSLRTWTRLSCSSWRARFAGEQAAIAADDGVNVILFHDDMWPPELVPGAIAQTVIHRDAEGRYHDADIHLNGKDFRFSLDGAPASFDLRSVLVHELGHALGLGHSDDPRATMFASGSGLRWRSLEQDDINGACALYPSPGAPSGPRAGGCDASPCPAPFVCVANACQRPGDRTDVCAPCARTVDACEAAGDEARCVDIGTDATAGRVCGRGCATNADCGAGFRCIATTTAGDHQCVSDLGCRNGSSPCQADADCIDSACRGGACLGPAGTADAGIDVPDAGARDGSTDGSVSLDPGGGGCACLVRGGPRPFSCAVSSTSSVVRALSGLCALVLLALRRRRR